jgi:chaperonin GroEL (HSP60 family)
MRGYSNVLNHVDDFFGKISIEFDPYSDKGKEILHKISKTTLNSKFVSLSFPELSMFGLNGILKSKGSIQDIQILKIKNGIISESKFFEDSILIKSSIKCELKESKIALISFDLNMVGVNKFSNSSQPKTNKNYSLMISNSDQLDRIIKEEETYFKNIVAMLKKQKIHLVLSQENFTSEGISDTLIQMFHKFKIQFVPTIKKEMMRV